MKLLSTLDIHFAKLFELLFYEMHYCWLLQRQKRKKQY